MAGSFIAISHHGVVDAFELLAKLYQKTGDLSEPLADIGEGLLLSHRDRWDAQESPEGEPWAPLSEKYRTRKPRHADLAQNRTGGNVIAHLHRHRALFHMAILGFPPAAMIHQHAIAAFTVLDRRVFRTKRQNIGQQNARTPATGMTIVDIKPGEGISE